MPPRESFPGDLAGAPVAVERGTAEEGLLAQRTDARVRALPSLASSAGRPAAAHDYLLDDLRLVDSGTELSENSHVMAVKLGEHAMLVRLERFLLSREAAIRRLLAEEGRP